MWGHDGRFNRDPLPAFPAGGPCEQFWHGQGCPLFDVFHPAFPLATTAWPTFQGVLKDGFREAVVTCDMPEPCKFPSLDTWQKRFPWTYKEVDPAPHPVVGLVLHVGDTEKFPQALDFEGLDIIFRVSKQGPRFTAIEEDGGDKRLVKLKLACEADGVAPPEVWPLLPLPRQSRCGLNSLYILVRITFRLAPWLPG